MSPPRTGEVLPAVSDGVDVAEACRAAAERAVHVAEACRAAAERARRLAQAGA